MKIYSVTEVLSKYVNWAKINPDVLAQACQRGTDTHTQCGLYANLGYFINPPPECLGYLESFQCWFDANVKKVILYEKRFTCKKFWFTGRLDFVFELNTDEIVLTDIKTPLAESKTWKGQLAAYDYLAEKEGGVKCDDIMSLRLKPDGTSARGVRYGNGKLQYFNTFLSALNAHRGLMG